MAAEAAIPARGGWVKLWRALLDKAIWLRSTPQQKAILITLLLLANHEGKQWDWQGQKFAIQPGQFVTSEEAIRSRCGEGISRQNVRTALERFERLGFLTKQTTKNGTLITIVNWQLYQGEYREADEVSGLNEFGESPRPNQAPNQGSNQEGNQAPNQAITGIYQENPSEANQAPNQETNSELTKDLTSNKKSKEVKEVSLSSPTAKTASKTSKRSRKADTDPRVKPTIAYFCERFLESTGMPYVVDWGKDGALIKGLPPEYTTEILCQLIDRFFAEKDRWVWEEAGPTIGVFKTRLPQLVAKHGLKKGGAACRETEDAEAIIARLYQQTGQKPAL